jgi:hypothetical protein
MGLVIIKDKSLGNNKTIQRNIVTLVNSFSKYMLYLKNKLPNDLISCIYLSVTF